MKKLILLSVIVLMLVMSLSANDKYVTYTQTFPWIGPEGEDPEVVFADLIEQGRLVSVMADQMHLFYYDPSIGYVNTIRKIKNDQEYIIKVVNYIPDNSQAHTIQVPFNRDPTVIIVDINGTGDYNSIQEGINNSVNGDTVLVYPGTYYENINYNGKNITLTSLYSITQDRSYIDSTVIDGNQSGSVVTLESGEDTTAVLCGFTIQNGSGTHDLGNIRGGGIFSKNADTKISNCIIKNNKAEGGAGVHCRYSNLILENTTICHNHALLVGGGLYLRDNSTATFSSENRCDIYLNYAGRGSDIATYQVEELNVIIDTFTVMVSNSYFALSEPENNFTFDILNARIEPINKDLYVSPDGDNNNSGLTQRYPLRNIVYALTRVTSDSTHPNIIHVANGMYSPSLTDEKFPLNCRNYVSLYGEDKEMVILDGENISNLLYIYDDNNFSIHNLTLQNGYSKIGGGIYFCSNSNPIIKNCSLKHNFAEIGTHIYCNTSCMPIFENVNIIGMSSLVNDVAIFLISNSDPTFINCVIENNHVNPNEYFTGAIDCGNQCNPILINTRISNNSALTASAITTSGDTEGGEVNLINCTISDNSDCNEGAIRQLINTNLFIINCILRNESQDEIWFLPNNEPSTVTVSYTNIKDSINGINTNNNGTIIWGDGNIDEDPMFIDTLNNNYQLQKGSPCIDAGTPDTTGLHLPARDLAGNQRIYNGRIDIGAYEYQGIGIDEPDTSFIYNLYLFQNTPNPFRKTTTISFISSDYERIKEYTLSIYNTKGQLVRRYEGSKDDFWVKTEIVWDGTDEQGKQVAAGTYLYKLEYNGHAVVRKMVLLR